MIFYAGIGSRKAPEHILKFMRGMGRVLASAGLVLRSGHSPGSDVAFEEGHSAAGGRMEIYLPWRRFNGSSSALYGMEKLAEAGAVAGEHHPGWTKMSNGAKMCIARNVFQVMGRGLDSPSAFVVGWSGGKGGTEFTFCLADSMNIPVVRLEEYQKLNLPNTVINDDELSGWVRCMTDKALALAGFLSGGCVEGMSPGEMDIERRSYVEEFFWNAAESWPAIHHHSVSMTIG
jgi:hypothetical protein